MHRVPVLMVFLFFLVSCGLQQEEVVKSAYKPTDTTLLEFAPLRRPEKYGWTWIYKKPVRLSKYNPVFVNTWDGFPGDSLYIHSADPLQTLIYYRYCDEFTMPIIKDDYITGELGVFRINNDTYGLKSNVSSEITFYRLAGNDFRELQTIQNPAEGRYFFGDVKRVDFNNDGQQELQFSFLQLTEPVFVSYYVYFFDGDKITRRKIELRY